MRRLLLDEHLGPEFATTWPEYDLDPKTRALLGYAKKLTERPGQVEDVDIQALRLEAASGLPMDRIPKDALFPEGMPDR